MRKLVFSITDVEHLLNGKRATKESIVFLTAVLEYMCAEICELSGNQARLITCFELPGEEFACTYKNTIITDKCVYDAINLDVELHQMFPVNPKLVNERFNIISVVKQVHPNLAINSLAVNVVNSFVYDAFIRIINAMETELTVESLIDVIHRVFPIIFSEYAIVNGYTWLHV